MFYSKLLWHVLAVVNKVVGEVGKEVIKPLLHEIG
jgi:hypothetical protein